ncbi:MAG: hypothetical protein K0U52_00650, partial [Gammaproteobacteria bacterium]|nr:hypothetical protein [Gammaproteobacteria bacterium]
TTQPPHNPTHNPPHNPPHNPTHNPTQQPPYSPVITTHFVRLSRAVSIGERTERFQEVGETQCPQEIDQEDVQHISTYHGPVEDDWQCVFCLESNTQTYTQTPCGHIFHRACFIQWNKHRCPFNCSIVLENESD